MTVLCGVRNILLLYFLGQKRRCNGILLVLRMPLCYNSSKDSTGGGIFMVGENIKRFREEKNISQSEIAEKLSVTRQAVSNWETGKTEPDIDTLHKIADILGVSIEELIYGERREMTVVHKHEHHKHITNGAARGGIGFGSVLAMVISYVEWQSVGWAILHGALNWVYVIYFLIKYR